MLTNIRLTGIAMLFMASVVWSQDTSPLRLADGSYRKFVDLHAISADWTFVFRMGDSTESVSSGQFVSWGNRVPCPRKPFVLLSDGTQIMLNSLREIVHLADGILYLEPSIWNPFRIPHNQLRAIAFVSGPTQAKQDEFLFQRLVDDRSNDVIELHSGQKLQGRVVQIDSDQIRIQQGAETLIVFRNHIRSILFADSNVQKNVLSQEHALVGMRDGSVLKATSVLLGDRQLTVQLDGKLQLKLKPSVMPVSEKLIQSVRLFGGAVKYLSDLQPFSYVHIPYLDLHWTYELDQNLFDGPLRYQSVPFSKGIAMHSLSRLAFRLPSGFDRFESELALDDSAGQGGSVVFRVFLEKDGRWVEEFHSDKMEFGMPTAECKVNLDQATGIALVVDGASDTDYLDHANWLDARIVRSKTRN